MRTNTFSLLNWRILSLVCVAGLLLAGFTEMQGQNSIAELRQEPLNLPVPIVPQSMGSSCGEAAIAMAYNYAHPSTMISEPQVIDYAISNGYYTPYALPFTSPANMAKIANYYADNISTGQVLNSEQGLSFLIQELQSGEPVIIDVLSNFRVPSSVAHFIVVTGISIDPSRADAVVIQYNDPLTGAQKSADWAGSQGVWNAWQTNGDPGGAGWWMAIH